VRFWGLIPPKSTHSPTGTLRLGTSSHTACRPEIQVGGTCRF